MHHITPTQAAQNGKWDGTRADPEQQFTDQQLLTMTNRFGTRANWDVRMVSIKTPRQPLPGEPLDLAVVERKVPCPVVSRGLENDQVIAPGGDIVTLKAKREPRK